jgi:hypothetical protein
MRNTVKPYSRDPRRFRRQHARTGGVAQGALARREVRRLGESTARRGPQRSTPSRIIARAAAVWPDRPVKASRQQLEMPKTDASGDTSASLSLRRSSPCWWAASSSPA